MLPSRQSAYRANCSTETALLAVHNDIIRAIDSGKVSALVLLDLSSAFDTVDHSVLLKTLEERFGIKGTTLDWFQSYLSGRKQAFKVANQQSATYDVDCSVPQGSVLGPQEFIAYTEDLANVVDRYQLQYHLYADDTQLVIHTRIDDDDDVKPARVQLQNCIESIRQWYSTRRLQFNASKTELIWFGTRYRLGKLEDIDISLQTSTDVIKPVKVVRDLGVLFDDELSMKQHMNKVTCACFYQLRRLKSVRRLLGQQITSNLVSAFIFSRLDYCNSLLAGLSKNSLRPLQRVQNAAARLVTGIGSRDHVTPALISLHWLPVYYRIRFKLCLIMHLVHIGRSPSYISDLVHATADLPGRSRLRSASSLRYEMPHTELALSERCFSFAGPSAWNSLPFNIQQQSNTATFKRLLKTHLFTLAYAS